ncbi:hypothetical protein Tco_0308495 [Tanacetum coccineum]
MISRAFHTKLEAFINVNSPNGMTNGTFPTLANTLKGLTYLGFNLPRLPNRTTPFQGRSFPLFLRSFLDHSVELLQLRPSTQFLDDMQCLYSDLYNLANLSNGSFSLIGKK